MMKTVYTLAAALLIGTAAFGQQQNGAVFERAQAAYDDGRYGEAAALYEELLERGIDNAEVHYNLANACFKNSELPNAVLHYRKAAYELPRDPDIAANLHFALNAAGAADTPAPAVERLLGSLSQAEWVLLGTAGYLLLSSLLLLLLCLKNHRRGVLRLMAVPLVLTALAYFGWRYWQGFEQNPEWVVSKTEATALFGPVEGSTAHFKLPLGALVRQKSANSKGWIEIEYDGKEGWLKEAYIRPVSP